MSINHCVPFLEGVSTTHPQLDYTGLFKMLRYEPLHRHDLGSSMALKACFLTFTSRTNVLLHCLGKKRNGKHFRLFHTALLRTSNSHLATMHNPFAVTVFHVDVSTKEK